MSNTILRNELNRALAIIKDEPHGNENLLCGEFLTDVGCAMCPISMYTGIQGYCKETSDPVAYVRLVAETLQHSLGNMPVNIVPLSNGNTVDVFSGVKLLYDNITLEEYNALATKENE